MNLLAFNQKYALFSNEERTWLLEVGLFGRAGVLELPTKLGHLQYGTGIAALVSSSKVRIYGRSLAS
jgi:hypothetical protein